MPASLGLQENEGLPREPQKNPFVASDSIAEHGQIGKSTELRSPSAFDSEKTTGVLPMGWNAFDLPDIHTEELRGASRA